MRWLGVVSWRRLSEDGGTAMIQKTMAAGEPETFVLSLGRMKGAGREMFSYLADVFGTRRNDSLVLTPS